LLFFFFLKPKNFSIYFSSFLDWSLEKLQVKFALFFVLEAALAKNWKKKNSEENKEVIVLFSY
jgi:hypothetical protein